MRLPPYDPEKLWKGCLAGLCSGLCFLLGVDTTADPFHIFHGAAQALVGLALYYLWQLVALNVAEKKTDGGAEYGRLAPERSFPTHERSTSWTLPSGRSGFGRVMSYTSTYDLAPDNRAGESADARYRAQERAQAAH